jgi:hypothetical protein
MSEDRSIINATIGGSDTEENLALACNRCDRDRYNFVVGRDLETSTILSLFNPRNQLWQEHFTWSVDATLDRFQIIPPFMLYQFRERLENL